MLTWNVLHHDRIAEHAGADRAGCFLEIRFGAHPFLSASSVCYVHVLRSPAERNTDLCGADPAPPTAN